MSLLELVVSMGLLAVIMVPVISMLGTSYKVMNASSDRQSGSYVRQTALDAATLLLHGSTRVLNASATQVTVLQASGATGQLLYNRGQLLWVTAAGSQIVATGLSGVRMSIGAAANSQPVCGELLLLEVAAQAPGEPNPSWSSTQIWIRPAI